MKIVRTPICGGRFLKELAAPAPGRAATYEFGDRADATPFTPERADAIAAQFRPLYATIVEEK